jgi:hypothetical protein
MEEEEDAVGLLKRREVSRVLHEKLFRDCWWGILITGGEGSDIEMI